MIHIDVRLQDQDFKLLDKIRSPEMIVALDDFEGLEKGMANYTKMHDKGLLESYQLVYPQGNIVAKARLYGSLNDSIAYTPIHNQVYRSIRCAVSY